MMFVVPVSKTATLSAARYHASGSNCEKSTSVKNFAIAPGEARHGINEPL